MIRKRGHRLFLAQSRDAFVAAIMLDPRIFAGAIQTAAVPFCDQ
jgi:hypothetical protein